MHTDKLFRERLGRFSREVVLYGQYMANGGVLMVAVFLTGLLAYYYPSLVQSIPAWLPVPVVLAAVLALFVTRTVHRTFLLEADLLFLTPAETRMAPYFHRMQLYNFIVQSIGLFLLLLLLMPLYKATMHPDRIQLWLYWSVPIVLKGWNVYSSWIMLRLPDKRKIGWYTLVRYALTAFLLAWMLSEGRMLAYGSIPYGVILWIGLLVWFHLRLRTISKRHACPWYRLLETEDGLRLRFYRIANQFRDVPSMQLQVKPRNWLVWTASLIPYRESNAGRILFLKSFLRSGDLAGMYIRIIVISSLLMLILPGVLAKAAVALLFLFLSAIQLKGIGSQVRHKSRSSLLPIDAQQQTSSARWVRRVLLVVQGALYMLVVWL